MAGRGPAPKNPSKRARSGTPGAVTLITFVQGEQPTLPEDIEWPERTREWWAMWGGSPMAEHFMASDWDYLLDTALLHAAVWGSGDFSKLAELRLRVAKFGQTPDDRARLQIQFADADNASGGKPAGRPSARERRGALLSLVPPGEGKTAAS